ncbi:MAG: O-antigen ligase family protein [Tenericutes bacterium]|nr:O-antigen ligase family protein [Mycoplasmatota bacterium]
MYFLGIGVITVILYKFYFRDKRDFKKVFAILTFSVLINNLIGWYEVISKNYIFLTAFNANYYSSISQRIPISMMGNPNDFALLTIFGLSISIPLIKLSINRIYLLLSYLFLTSNIILLFLTYSRSSLLGAIVIGLFYLLANFYKTRTRVFLSFIIAMIVFLIFVFTPLIYTRFIFFLDFDFNANFLNSELIRINLMKNGFHILNLTYGFGTGPGNLEYWISTYSIYPTRGITSMHNWWLEILVTYGLLIFILYLLFYFNLVKNLWKVHSRVIDKFTREFANGLLFFMLAFTISSFGSSSNFNKEWLWVIWGICIAFQGYTHRIIYAISSRIEVIT